jgi:hypothetical protein
VIHFLKYLRLIVLLTLAGQIIVRFHLIRGYRKSQLASGGADVLL